MFMRLRFIVVIRDGRNDLLIFKNVPHNWRIDA